MRDEGSRLEVQVPRWPQSIRLSYVWLRDHCRCDSCYNFETQQRRFDVHNIPLNVRPLAVKPSSQVLNIECEYVSFLQ